MRRTAVLLIASLAIAGCSSRQASNPAQPVSTAGFSGHSARSQRKSYRSLVGSIPLTPTFIFTKPTRLFLHSSKRLNIRVLNIIVPRTPDQRALDQERKRAWGFVRASHSQATLCTTFNPFNYRNPRFVRATISQIDRDFSEGAVAVKIWKNIGEQVKDAKGNYVLPDNPAFEPIYKDIAAHNKTLIAHVADPDTIWEPPTPAAPDYSYYMEHPEWYMYNKPNAPSKYAILRARDHLLRQNPDLRVVGAHLGSMEADFNQISQHLDDYPNFAVDLAARMPYLVAQPRADMIAFIESTRIGCSTRPTTSSTRAATYRRRRGVGRDLRIRLAIFFDQRYPPYRDRRVQGLNLPEAVLRKLYHQNAGRWIPAFCKLPLSELP